MAKLIKMATKIKKEFLFIFIILLVGIFLRTYEFHDWLRFNADQGRDSVLVSDVLTQREAWPLLGPKAGGTDFKLGPAFYYFEIISAKIFGNYPDKVAYPDLLTGILSIVLIYVLACKYFNQKIALVISLLYAVSNYAVRYARFAWNPNSTPFWTMLTLLAIVEILSKKQNNKWLWSIVAGISIGIGMQLHTTLLILLPAVVAIIFGYVAVKNVKSLKYLTVIVAFSILMNIPQLVYEYKSHGQNAQSFFEGAKKKQENESIAGKTWQSASCLIQTNASILSGWEISDTCKFKPEKNKDDLVIFIISFIFIIGGIILGIRGYKKENNHDKKIFLGVVSVFCIATLVLFIPIALELSVRFYLILIFLPFLLLGFWLNFLEEKLSKKAIYVALFLTTLLALSNLFFIKKYFADFASYAKNGGTVNVVILSQVEDFANFIVMNSSGEDKNVLVSGNAKFLFKAFKPIKYLASLKDVNIEEITKDGITPQSYFYIARSARKEAFLKDPNIIVKAYKTHGKFTILLIEVK